MSDLIRIDITGDRQAGLRFEEFPDALHDDLLKEIESLSDELFGRVNAATPVASGKLRSQERVRVYDKDGRISGVVTIDGQGSGKGSDFAKAGALEYGSKGKAANVAAHPMALDHYWHEKLVAPVTVLVKAHARVPNIAEHSFMRGPLAAMRPEAMARLNAVVEKAVETVNR